MSSDVNEHRQSCDRKSISFKGKKTIWNVPRRKVMKSDFETRFSFFLFLTFFMERLDDFIAINNICSSSMQAKIRIIKCHASRHKLITCWVWRNWC